MARASHTCMRVLSEDENPRNCAPEFLRGSLLRGSLRQTMSPRATIASLKRERDDLAAEGHISRLNSQSWMQYKLLGVRSSVNRTVHTRVHWLNVH
jgi:hypothetical protein